MLLSLASRQTCIDAAYNFHLFETRLAKVDLEKILKFDRLLSKIQTAITTDPQIVRLVEEALLMSHCAHHDRPSRASAGQEIVQLRVHIQEIIGGKKKIASKIPRYLANVANALLCEFFHS